jgi:hypothetical protein
VTAASLGLATVFAMSSIAFTAVKYLGAAYLIFLGARSLFASGSARMANDGIKLAPAGLRRIFADGFVVALFNPKTSLSFAAFLPQFLPAGAGTGFWAKRVLWLPWVFNVESGQGSVGVALGRSKFIRNGWCLTVVSKRLASPRIRLGKKRPRYDPAELEVCRTIHSFLAQAPGIVDLRWYCQSSGSQTPAVDTPDELPWHES